MARPEPKPWRQAALGSLLVALGAALFGVPRKGRSDAAAKPEPSRRSSPGKTTPAIRAKPAGGRPARKRAGMTKRRDDAQTLHWPPRDRASEKAADQGAGPAEAASVPVDPASETLGYEVRDTRVGALGRTIAIGVASIAVGIVAMFFMIGSFRSADVRRPALTPQQSAVIVPPGPRLQAHPIAEVAAEFKRESDRLDGYGFLDATRARARIPIGRAMAIVTGKPLDPPK